MLVTLTSHEMYLSGLVGFRRNLESIVHRRKPRFPEKVPGELFGFHIIAAMAECAAAKAYGIYWSFHVNSFDKPDVGNFEVRYSRRTDLKVRERDSGIVVSVTGYPPDFQIAGWIEASEAKSLVEPSSPRSGPSAYFVPHQLLREPESLLTVL